MNSLLPESDREFILSTIQKSEDRQTRRLGVVLERVEKISDRQDQFEEHILKNGRANVRSVAISTGTIISVITGLLGWALERWM